MPEADHLALSSGIGHRSGSRQCLNAPWTGKAPSVVAEFGQHGLSQEGACPRQAREDLVIRMLLREHTELLEGGFLGLHEAERQICHQRDLTLADQDYIVTGL